MTKAQALRRYLNWIDDDRGAEESIGPDLDLTDLHLASESIPDRRLEAAQAGMRSLQRSDRELTELERYELEAIVLPGKRPVIDVVDGTFELTTGRFGYFGRHENRVRLEAAIASVGRVEVPDHPWLPFAGTGFVVGENLVMTNRHVAEVFAAGLGREGLSFRSGQRADVDFKRERGRDETSLLEVADVVMIHPYWDMALLRVRGLPGYHPALSLTTAHPADLADRDVAVIGYPALDRRNEIALQQEIFGGVFDVKRLQPGRLREIRPQLSYANMVDAVTHDCSTLGGNSGSCVVDVDSGQVVALHFAGRYLEANFAVPTHELARDGYVVDTGVNFDGSVSGELQGAPTGSGGTYDRSPWADQWTAADPPEHRPEFALPPVDGDDVARVIIPVEVTVRIVSEADAPATSSPRSVRVVSTGPEGGAPTVLEAMVEPFHDKDLDSRSGYDDGFLGLRLDLPTVRDLSRAAQLTGTAQEVELRYEHFSVIMDRHRRLAMMTASNVDARPNRREPEPDRDYTRRGLGGLSDHDIERWFTDPRILPDHQLPDRFFTKDRKSFDKGHLVRRADVVWGDTYDEVRQANGDTYHVTNCSPQVKGFNRVNLGGIWGRLENLVLTVAETELLSVFAGPLLADDDPIFVGVDDDSEVRIQIPRRFWKVLTTRGVGGLESFAFLLDQDLSATDLEMTVPVEWRRQMIAVPRLTELIGNLEFPDVVVEGDQIASPHGEDLRSVAGGLETIR